MKHWILFLWSLFLINQLSAQGWERTYGDEEAREIILASDGNYVVLGEDKLTKIDELGEMIWQQSIGGKLIRSTNDDGYIIADPNLNVGMIKTDGSGVMEWEVYMNDTIPHYIDGLVQMDNDDYVILGHMSDTSITDGGVFLMRFDPQGNVLWKERYGGNQFFDFAFFAGNLAKTDEGDLVFGASVRYYEGEVREDRIAIVKVSGNGVINWIKEMPESFPTETILGRRFIGTDDGGFIMNTIDVFADGPGFGYADLHVIKADANGDVEWSNFYRTAPSALTPFQLNHIFHFQARGLTETADGSYLSAALSLDESSSSTFGRSNIRLIKIANDGTTLWQRDIGQPGISNLAYSVIEDSEGSILIAGQKTGECYVIKLDSLGYAYSNKVSGNVFEDLNENCLLENDEPGFANWMVEADGTNDFYALTDSLGNYTLYLDTGTYVLNVISPSPYWTSCIADVEVVFNQFYDSLDLDFPMDDEISCPYLTVDIGTPFLRRCFDNNYYVNYCNSGTSDAEDALVEIAFDPYLSVIDASIPYDMVDGLYQFEIGDLAVNECGSFTVKVNVDCDSTVLGQTHCVEAHIYPDSLCLPPSPEWSGASLNLDASCVNGEVLFTVKNVGDGNMINDLNYIVIEDHIIMSPGVEPPLEIGQQTMLPTIPANGATYRLEVEPIPGHPNPGTPSIAIEGCSNDPDNFISLGFITMYPENDGSPFVSIDCQENIGSFDPNDKMAYPKGYEEGHYIEANTDLEYRIRFQNTGTDTAFTVLIIDTLSSFLDVSTIRAGASSHSYQMNVDPKGTLSFLFENIMLPDSNVNELASHGFIKFKISQKRDNPIGTQIYNEAGIYFDNNLPIITNETWHTIGEEFIATVSTKNIKKPGIDLQVYPNPFVETATFEIKGNDFRQIHFRLFDAVGRQVRQEQYVQTHFDFYRNNLTTGMYFYEILGDGELIANGKLMID